MNKARPVYIHELKKWPNFFLDHEKLMPLLGKVRNKQGVLLGKMRSIGFDLQQQASLQNLTLDVLKSSEIEGEILNAEQVRSSIASKLGLNLPGLKKADRHTEGVVEMMLDATQNHNKPLTKERLVGWQASLFPTGHSGMYKITIGKWRIDETGPMQVVSGAMGKERVHFQAPEAKLLEGEMKRFILWFNTDKSIDPIIKAAIAHLWFVTIHPFDDGNGRIARALTDLLLARADDMSQRFYSMSAQILIERKGYYEILERTQKGSLNITSWLEWFLCCLYNALENSEIVVEQVLVKASFWEKHKTTHFNPRQIKMLNKWFDGLDGRLTTSKWAKMNKCSQDTALRDIQDLLVKKVLVKEEGGGRSTSYLVNSNLSRGFFYVHC